VPESSQEWRDRIEALVIQANTSAQQLSGMINQLVQALEIAERELAHIDRYGAVPGDPLVRNARAAVSAALSLAHSREN
jgi:hypothetical protein